MSDLPEGWDVYEPHDNELSGDPGYQRARQAAAKKAEHRRAEYGKALASLRQARSLTQVALASQLGVAQGEISRIEHQTDLLLSTLARYVEGMGGELSMVVRFANETFDLGLDEWGGQDPPVAPDLATVAELGGLLGRYDSREERFRAAVPA
jgi:transcriptional regulator with XRE-family HTH domain